MEYFKINHWKENDKSNLPQSFTINTHNLPTLGKILVKAFQNIINILLNIYLIQIFLACI